MILKGKMYQGGSRKMAYEWVLTLKKIGYLLRYRVTKHGSKRTYTVTSLGPKPEASRATHQ